MVDAGVGPADARAVEHFRELALLHRGRTGLTQRGLAARMGVHVRSVQAWEGGISCPDAAHLRALLAAYLAAGGLAPGHELAQAQALWAAALRDAPRLRTPFDQAWFTGLLAEQTAQATRMAESSEAVPAPDHGGVARRPNTATAPLVRQDWGEAPSVAAFLGRAEELETLTQWVREERCRVVALLGLGGIGKTMLAARLAHAVAPSFDRVYWRSLRNAPPPRDWLAGVLGFLAPQLAPPREDAARLTALLELLRVQRCLLVLDNVETVLQVGEQEGRYREGYSDYGVLLPQLSQSPHRSCLLLTSREAPAELGPLAGERASVRTFELGGLSVDDARTLLHEKGLSGDAAAWAALVARYGGNALALKVAAESIRQFFGGEVAAYLAHTAASAPFGGIRRLLDAQLARSSALEHTVLRSLAVSHEPVTFSELAADLRPAITRGEALEAVEALRRRSLLERGAHGATFTLQPVVLECVTDELVEAVSQEIATGHPVRLVEHALVKATAEDYVRQSQERLICEPILKRLQADGGDGGAERLLALLRGWRGCPHAVQGYGPGNVVNLLRLLRGDLRGLDLAGLALRQAYLAGVEAQDACLANAHLSEAVLAEAFSYPISVALSGDGALLVAGTSTGEVWLWRVADRTPLLAVAGHTGPVYGVTLSADEQLLASGGDDGTIRLWEARSGRPLATLLGHTAAVRSVAVSANGHLLASSSFDGVIRLWETSGGRPLATLPGHAGPAYSVALSADGRLLASGGEDGAVRLWEPSGDGPLATLKGHTGGVRGVALSPDGRLLASAGFDQTVRLWDVPGGELLRTLEGHTGLVYGVAFGADGRLLASASFDGTVRLWEAPSGSPLAALHGHTGGVRSVAASASGGILASGGWDGTVRLWQAPSGRPLATLEGHTGLVYGVALSGDGRLLAAGGFDGAIRLWDAGSGRLLATLLGHSGAIRSVALSADGRLLASGALDGTIRLWETSTNRPLATFAGHAGGTHSVALGGDGRLLASCRWDGAIQLWDALDGRPLATLRGHAGPLYGVALSADGRLLASSGEDGTVRLWDARDGRPIATLDAHADSARGVALSADGRLVASCRWDGAIQLWETTTGQPLATLRGHTGPVHGVAFSADAALLASGSGDGTVRLWDAPSGRQVATLEGHTGGVWGVTLSRDGQWLASGSFDGTIRLWDAAGGVCRHALRSDRRYERMDIADLTGVTAAQRAALVALGAVDRRQVDAAPTDTRAELVR